MKIDVNGKGVDLEKQFTISELLKKMEVKMPDMVSVELNGKIIRKDQYDEMVVKDGDKVEFLYFMGGGNGFFRRTD